MGSEASRTGVEGRMLELAGRLVEVEAPAHWSNARLEAWLDWAGGRPDLEAAILEYAYSVTAQAHAKDLIKDLRGRTRFRMDLTEAMLQGALAFAPGGGRPEVIEAGPALDAFVARHRGREAARAAAAALQSRLQAVMDAILRCEGEPEACADPLRNTSLARAAEAARAGGASDAMILDAIALAHAGHADWPCGLEDATSGLAIAFGEPAALALAGWATGAVVAARDRAHAEAIAEAAALPRAGVDLAAFWGDAGYDLAGLQAGVALAASALAAQHDGPSLVALAGLGDWLMAQGLDYDSDAGRATALALFEAARAAVGDARLGLVSDPELALRLGARLDALPGAGPVALAEAADGEIQRVLSDPALRGLAALGAPRDEVAEWLLGARSLAEAPGAGRRALLARGFTTHEIE